MGTPVGEAEAKPIVLGLRDGFKLAYRVYSQCHVEPVET
jgi:hypothetical protein